jgi:hypothetical protein
MFTVKWIARFDEGAPVEVEDSVFTDIEKVFSIAKERLYQLTLRHSLRPPDGFLICDEDGREHRRWREPSLAAAAEPEATSLSPARRSRKRAA